MRMGITLRVAASHVLLVVVALAVFSGIVVVATDHQLTATGTNVDRATALRLVPWIEELHQRRNSWSDVDQALRGPTADEPPRARRSPMMMDNRGPMMRPNDRAAAPFLERDVVVVGRSGEILAASASVAPPEHLERERGVPVGSAESPDAWVFVGSMISDQDNPIRRAIMRSFLRAGTVAALIILLGATIVSALWARWLLHPIRNIVHASRAMEDGNYSVSVPEPAGNHELRTLARSFNAMAAEVAKQEGTRRRFMADAAHELRTPISLLSGRIELLRDGVYETTREQWNALHQSVNRIATLVSDLQTIARLDAGRVTIEAHPVDPLQILQDVAEEFRPAAHAKSITISMEIAGAPSPGFSARSAGAARPVGSESPAVGAGSAGNPCSARAAGAGASESPAVGAGPAGSPSSARTAGAGLTGSPAVGASSAGSPSSARTAGASVTGSRADATGPDFSLAPRTNTVGEHALPPVTADPGKLHQILGNLLSNALRHTPEGGVVTLSVGSATRTQSAPAAPALQRTPAAVPGSALILAVEDSGPGIPPAERERIFERFVRLDADRGRSHGGSGLGLSITQRLVALHGGTIRAVEPTTPAGGARLEVELPQ